MLSGKRLDFIFLLERCWDFFAIAEEVVGADSKEATGVGRPSDAR